MGVNDSSCSETLLSAVQGRASLNSPLRRSANRNIILGLAFGLMALTSAAQAAITASGNSGNPSTITPYNGSQGGFTISEDVAFDPSAGPWVKQLVNTGGGISSGMRVNISETFTNAGPVAWTDWHEEIISTTDMGTGGPQPGFLFDENSLSVSVDNGGGFQLLTEGLDYTLAQSTSLVLVQRATIWVGRRCRSSSSPMPSFSPAIA